LVACRGGDGGARLCRDGGGFGLGRWGIRRSGVAGGKGEKNEECGEDSLLHGGSISGSLMDVREVWMSCSINRLFVGF
jgi:hypothetical protein